MKPQERALGDVLSVSLDTVSVDPADSYSVAGVYGFGRGLFKRGPLGGTETSYPHLNRLSAGKLVMSRLKAFEGALSVIPEEFDGWYLSPEFPTFAIDPKEADLRYVAHLCAWPEFWKRLSANSTGLGARKVRVNAGRLLTIKVPLPDLDEQRRIAARLDSALGKLQRIEGLRGYCAKIGSAFAASAVDQAIEQCTDSERLGSLLKASRTPIEIDQDLPYRALGMRSFGKGTIRYPAAPGRELSKLRYFKFPADALVLSNIKAWEGAIGLTAAEDLACVASNRFLFYSARDERTNLSYLRHYLLSRKGLAQISMCSPGSADRNRTLSIKRFEDLIVRLPSRNAQDRLATQLDSLGVHLDPSRTEVTQAALRPSLLNAAFSGQL